MAELRIDRFTERVMVAGSGCVLALVIATFDDTIRGRIAGVFSGNGLSQLSVMSAQFTRHVRSAQEAVGFTGTEEPTMVYFAIAAVVLFVAMLRT